MRRTPLAERLLSGLARVAEQAGTDSRIAERAGFLQQLDPRLKLGGLLTLIVTAVCLHTMTGLAWLGLSALLLAAASRVGPGLLLRRVWLPAGLFAGLVALPALFLVPGRIWLPLPAGLPPVTAPGLRSTLFLLLRTEVTATLAVLAPLTTPWPHLLKALRALGVPALIVALLGMTQRYLFVLLTVARQMAEGRASRLLGTLPPRAARQQAAAMAGTLLARSLHLADEVHLAMLARGYRGEMHIMTDFRPGWRDAVAAVLFAAFATTAFFMPAIGGTLLP